VFILRMAEQLRSIDDPTERHHLIVKMEAALQD